MSHTPGPLTIEGPTQRQLPNDLGGDYAILSPDGKIIAECFHVVDEETYADALANARLLAAAPDLLEACEDAAWLLRDAAWLLRTDSHALKVALAAIAKAKGVSNV